MTKSFAYCLLLAVFTAGMTGCIAQTQHDDLRTMYRKAQERIVELQAEVERLQGEIAAMRASSGHDANLASKLREAEAEIARLRAEMATLAAGPGTDLSPELQSALEDLAARYPGLMTFDPDRKMIKMQSDLTFDLGSTKVKPAAAQSLASLAQVLRSADAQQFEVRVVGHTDNVPVTNPANRQKFEDNWGLSAFRAKSVMAILGKGGVSEARMSIAGYGQQQPVVANPARGGSQANRRVEIYLTTPYNPGGAPAATPSAPADEVRPAPAPETSREPAEGPEMFK